MGPQRFEIDIAARHSQHNEDEEESARSQPAIAEYYAGDILQGHVLVELDKPLRMRGKS